MYGGLGTHDQFGPRGTSHDVAPTVAWTLANGVSMRVSPSFGVTGDSAGFLLRVGASYWRNSRRTAGAAVDQRRTTRFAGYPQSSRGLGCWTWTACTGCRT